MDVADWLVQNFSAVLQGVITTVLGYVAIRILGGIKASTNRTEEHAKETAAKVSALDSLSTGSYQNDLDEWKQEILRRVEGLAESKSDTLAWQAQYDRRLRALEQFAEQLSAFAHGDADVPTFTTTTSSYVLQEETA